jgi:hypothetical protein
MSNTIPERPGIKSAKRPSVKDRTSGSYIMIFNFQGLALEFSLADSDKASRCLYSSRDEVFVAQICFLGNPGRLGVVHGG